MSEAPETISDERLHKLAAMQTNDRIGRMTKDEHDSLIAEVIAGRAAIEKLREALKPFAKVADMLLFSGAITANEIELGALIAARAALNSYPGAPR